MYMYTCNIHEIVGLSWFDVRAPGIHINMTNIFLNKLKIAAVPG